MNFLKNFLSNKLNIVNVKNVKDNSTVLINIFNTKWIKRQNLTIDSQWFNSLLDITFDHEIKSKYISELHTLSNVEERYLLDIVSPDTYISNISHQVKICNDYITRFKKSLKDLEDLIEVEKLQLNASNQHIISVYDLKTYLPNILSTLNTILIYARNKNFKSIKTILERNEMTTQNHGIDYYHFDWYEFVDKEPSDLNVLRYVFKHYVQVFYELRDLNNIVENSNISHKIIIGNAGSGKTHLCAFLIEQALKYDDYVIFFKPKQFNGDNINFNQRLLEILNVPDGYLLNEVLENINNFVRNDNKRCFFIFDALNETTKSTIGFSDIWYNSLQEFINLVNQYSHIQLICTLRTSYVENIWNVRPANLIVINGFKQNSIKDACERYFEYYKIKPSNIDIADLTIFEKPLLLDLYCKLLKSDTGSTVHVELGMKTYTDIFQHYILKLTSEVKNKLKLQKDKPILLGLNKSSKAFYGNNEAILSLDEFTDSFDTNDLISQDNSIARAVLDGYLLFVKDYIKSNVEIIKHTQQEVGGFLLTKYLIELHSNIYNLLAHQEFIDKVLIEDTNKNHQLRLDILKFLIALKPEIITKISGKEPLRLSWWYLFNGFSSNSSEIPDFLISNNENNNLLEDIFDYGHKFWFIPNHKFNFDFLSKILKNMDRWSYDKSWTFYIYKNADLFKEIIEHYTNNINECEISQLKLVSKFISYTLSTTIRDLRDLATKFLVEFGKKYPEYLLKLTSEFTNHVDIYIYERLVSSCYGICLISQNNEAFVKEVLPQFVDTLYSFQFASNSKQRALNYIVIDSIKHLIDLAIFKNVYTLDKAEIDKISNYSFEDFIWKEPNKEQKELIYKSGESRRPPPIGMDFGIYTIPRLIEGYEDDLESIANVYAKIYQDGYVDYKHDEFDDELFKEFYFGHRIQSFDGKVDSLGKKYSWNAFFDYAGHLLQKGKLNVFEIQNEQKNYIRLSDVDIDVSFPNKNYRIEEEIFKYNLLKDRSTNPKWYNNVVIDNTFEIFQQKFDNEEYVLLNGFIEQRMNDEYKIRSLLIIETIFINKTEYIKDISGIFNKVFEWDSGINIHKDYIRRTYFGEMFWADNVAQNSENYVFIPTGKIIDVEKNLSVHDVLYSEGKFSYEDIGKVITEQREEKLQFQAESTISEFLWETDSNIIEGFSEFYPSIKMAKDLSLVVDPISGNILDKNLEICYKTVHYNNNSQDFNYFKKELLKDYMSKNNLALLFQVKQHSYDENYDHNRKLKFYFLDFD